MAERKLMVLGFLELFEIKEQKKCFYASVVALDIYNGVLLYNKNNILEICEVHSIARCMYFKTFMIQNIRVL